MFDLYLLSTLSDCILLLCRQRQVHCLGEQILWGFKVLWRRGGVTCLSYLRDRGIHLGKWLWAIRKLNQGSIRIHCCWILVWVIEQCLFLYVSRLSWVRLCPLIFFFLLLYGLGPGIVELRHYLCLLVLFYICLRSTLVRKWVLQALITLYSTDCLS